MSKRRREENYTEEINVWASFTDLMSNAFMILSLLLIIVMVGKNLTKTETQTELEKTESRAVEAEKKLTQLQEEINRLNNEISTKQKAQTPDNAPPIIIIQDTGAYQFQSGSADLSGALTSYINNQIVNQIESAAAAYKIDVIEIIGHTDGQPNNYTGSNLDLALEGVAKGSIPSSSLTPSSNADLGLMRALAVANFLRSIQYSEGRLKNLQFRSYSAAQLVLPNGELAPPDRKADSSRRRIEIRFTRLGKVENIR